jgi:hypothetical protein
LWVVVVSILVLIVFQNSSESIRGGVIFPTGFFL